MVALTGPTLGGRLVLTDKLLVRFQEEITRNNDEVYNVSSSVFGEDVNIQYYGRGMATVPTPGKGYVINGPNHRGGSEGFGMIQIFPGLGTRCVEERLL